MSRAWIFGPRQRPATTDRAAAWVAAEAARRLDRDLAFGIDRLGHRPLHVSL